MKENKIIFYILYFILFLNSILCAEEKLSITIGGDVMFDRGIKSQIKNIGFDEYFNKFVKYFRSPDFGIVNLECAITNFNRKTPKQFNFRGDNQTLFGLRKIGVTHVNLANNHSIDFGSCGLKETIENAKKANLIPIGFSDSKIEECIPAIIEKNGIRVAVFSSVMLKLPYYHFDTCSNFSICQQFTENLIKNISIYRETNPNDKILVLLHWGWENTKKARYSQFDNAKKIINSGADLIIGTHPHVIQNVAKINGKYVFIVLEI